MFKSKVSFEDRLSRADLRAGLALTHALHELDTAAAEGEAVRAEVDAELERLSAVRSHCEAVTITAGQYADDLRKAVQ